MNHLSDAARRNPTANATLTPCRALRLIRSSVSHAFFVLVLAAVATGCDSAAGAFGPAMRDDEGMVIIRNDHSSAIIDEVLFASCNADRWGLNRLADSRLPPGDSASWNVRAGCVWVRVRTTSGVVSQIESMVRKGETSTLRYR